MFLFSDNMEEFLNGNVLLVGEGDFSFSVSLVDRLGSCCSSCNVTATSFETEESITKHVYAAEHIDNLKTKGGLLSLIRYQSY